MPNLIELAAHVVRDLSAGVEAAPSLTFSVRSPSRWSPNVERPSAGDPLDEA